MPRTAVVTGSASGIGRSTKELLERSGARVIGVDRRDAEVVADLSTPEGRAAMIDGVRSLSGGAVDAVIACAGVSGGQGRPDQIVRINYFGAQATLAGLRPLLAAGTEPRAAVITSSALLRETLADLTEACLAGDEELAVSLCGSEGPAAYASSKRAIARWVRRMAPSDEWAGAKIALNAVAPGVVATPMTEYLTETEEKRAGVIASIPQPLLELGAAEHIAALLVWLTSSENGFVTGQVIFADGGFEALVRGDDLPRYGFGLPDHALG